jgi:hypothetical protein
MTEPLASQRAPVAATRSPANWQEALIANCRPQPAIPAALIGMLALSFAVILRDPQTGLPATGVAAIFVSLGIGTSCGLAIAAGFCSLVPQAIWLALAFWGLRLTASGTLPAYNTYVLTAGMVAVVIMFAVQVWRIKTRRFVPSILLSTDAD